MPQVVTANHLLEGDVIYLTAAREWTRKLKNAGVVDGSAAEELLTFAEAQLNEVVGAYLFDVDVSTGTPLPTHFREEFRTRGPSNYFHGKQAECTGV